MTSHIIDAQHSKATPLCGAEHGVCVDDEHAQCRTCKDFLNLRKALNEADTLEDAIGLALGAASTCWDNLSGAGVFQSERAGFVSQELLTLVRDYVR